MADDAASTPATGSVDGSRTQGGGLPFAVSLLILLGLMVAIVLLARTKEVERERSEAAKRQGATNVGVNDILTGRPLDANGIPERPKEGPGSTEQPIRLRFLASADNTEQRSTIDQMLPWIEARTGYAIDGALLGSYGLVIQELLEGQCDIAFLTAASYARARFATDDNGTEDDDIVAILAAVRQGHDDYPGADLSYRAALLVHKDSTIRSVEDITNDTTVAMGAPTSGASSLLPSAYFRKIGVRPKVTRMGGGGYPIRITAVLQRSVDLTSIWWSAPTQDNPNNDARITARGTHKNVFDDTRIIGFTEWIPNEPVVARKALPEAVRHDLARALALYINSKALTPDGRKELESVGSLVGYLPANDEDFEPLLDIVRRAFADDPEGLADFTRKR